MFFYFFAFNALILLSGGVLYGVNVYEYYEGEALSKDPSYYNVAHPPRTIDQYSNFSPPKLKFFTNATIYDIAPENEQYMIKLTIDSRGSTSIIACLREGTEPQVEVKDIDVLKITAREADMVGALQKEKYHYLKKDFIGAGYLMVVTNEIFGYKNPTRISIEVLPLTPLNYCEDSCNSGECGEALKCICPEKRFGRVCDKIIYQMAGEEFERDLSVKPFSSFFFMDASEEKQKGIIVNIESDDLPIMTMLINESPDLNYDFATRREKNNSASLLIWLDGLEFGEEGRSLEYNKNWIFFSFTNHEEFEVELELEAKRVTQEEEPQLLYYIIGGVFILILLFGLGLCCKLKGQRASATRREMRVVQNQQREDDKTLKEEDFNRFFPLVEGESLKVDHLKEEICSICLDKVVNGEIVRQIKFCNHYFHNKCLRSWLEVNESCPNCKFNLTREELIKKEADFIVKKDLIKTEEKNIKLFELENNPIERRRIKLEKKLSSLNEAMPLEHMDIFPAPLTVTVQRRDQTTHHVKPEKEQEFSRISQVNAEMSYKLELKSISSDEEEN